MALKRFFVFMRLIYMRIIFFLKDAYKINSSKGKSGMRFQKCNTFLHIISPPPRIKVIAVNLNSLQCDLKVSEQTKF